MPDWRPSLLGAANALTAQGKRCKKNERLSHAWLPRRSETDDFRAFREQTRHQLTSGLTLEGECCCKFVISWP